MNVPFPKPDRATIRRAACAGRCAVLVAAAFAAIACSTPRDTRTTEERAQDQAIVERVKAALQADPTVYAEHIDVSAKRGVVSLSGWVMSDPESRQAKADSVAVPGVRRVENRLEVPDITLER